MKIPSKKNAYPISMRFDGQTNLHSALVSVIFHEHLPLSLLQRKMHTLTIYYACNIRFAGLFRLYIEYSQHIRGFGGIPTPYSKPNLEDCFQQIFSGSHTSTE